MSVRRILGVDPGVQGTGWALVCNGGLRPRLLSAGTITPRFSRADWVARMEDVVEGFDGVLATLTLDAVAMECPTFYGNLGGMAAAGSGALVKLCLLTGGLARCVQARPQLGLTLATPNEWKGQLSKHVSWQRCRHILHDAVEVERLTEHAQDAVGIALWALGLF